jgi:hypothetical protein
MNGSPTTTSHGDIGAAAAEIRTQRLGVSNQRISQLVAQLRRHRDRRHRRRRRRRSRVPIRSRVPVSETLVAIRTRRCMRSTVWSTTRSHWEPHRRRSRRVLR